MGIPEDLQKTLLQYGLSSIEHGLDSGAPLVLEPGMISGPLQERRASFVTLTHDSALRGCIGSLEARTSLIEDVVQNAFNAAFRDPRFPALTRQELASLSIQISVLEPAVPVDFGSEQELLDTLRPGIDGIILKDGQRQATFLPSVWESLPQAEDFLRQLKRKAGLPEDHWSDSMEIWRYSTQSFSASVRELQKNDPGNSNHQAEPNSFGQS